MAMLALSIYRIKFIGNLSIRISKARSRFEIGDIEGGSSLAKTAKNLNIAGVIFDLIIIVIVLVNVLKVIIKFG